MPSQQRQRVDCTSGPTQRRRHQSAQPVIRSPAQASLAREPSRLVERWRDCLTAGRSVSEGVVGEVDELRLRSWPELSPSLGMVMVKPGGVEALFPQARSGPPGWYRSGSLRMLFQIAASIAGVKAGWATSPDARSTHQVFRPGLVLIAGSTDGDAWIVVNRRRFRLIPSRRLNPSTISPSRTRRRAPDRLGVRVNPFMRHLKARGASHAAHARRIDSRRRNDPRQ